MDFMERLTEELNTLDLPTEYGLQMGYLGVGESLVMYPMPGGRTIQEYMSGAKDRQLNYEIAMKSKSQQNLHNTLWKLQNHIEELKDLNSNDGSFQFENIVITNTPYINQSDEQGWHVFLLNLQAEITVFKEGEIINERKI